MKRIGLSLALPLLALVLGISAPRDASAAGWRSGGHAAAPAFHGGGGGFRGGFVGHAAPHFAAPARGYGTRPAYGVHVGGGVGARPGYGARPAYGYGARPAYGYGARPAYGYGYGSTIGHWGWHGPTRVWIGAAAVAPYPGWIWSAGQWTWDGYQWVWQDGFWAPPAY
jgi:hypothetical protein